METMLQVLTRYREKQPWLFWYAVAAVVGSLVTGVLIFVDPRLVTGAPVWLKPFKFFVSTAIYAATLMPVLDYLESEKWVRRVGSVTAAGLGFELLAISFQAARGVRSHFNQASAFDIAVFASMGITIMVVWAMAVVSFVQLRKSKAGTPLIRLAFTWGLLIFLLAAVSGNSMTRPKPDQLAALAAHERISEIGGHTVGAADGGPGLPLTGWSKDGGDLRVAHFFGMHALQVIPLLAFVIGRSRAGSRADRFSSISRRNRHFVHVVGATYLALWLLVLIQAFRAEPLLAPSSFTLFGFAAIVSVSSVALLLTYVSAHRSRASDRVARNEALGSSRSEAIY